MEEVAINRIVDLEFDQPVNATDQLRAGRITRYQHGRHVRPHVARCRRSGAWLQPDARDTEYREAKGDATNPLV